MVHLKQKLSQFRRFYLPNTSSVVPVEVPFCLQKPCKMIIIVFNMHGYIRRFAENPLDAEHSWLLFLPVSMFL